MSSRHVVQVALALTSPLVLQACATKGFVRTEVAATRTQLESAIASERDARIAADNDINARIAALRTDLDSLKTLYGARIAAVEDGLRFAMPVNFEFDDATVRGEYRPMLERFARVARAHYPNSVITIEGFADPAGSQDYNLALSRRRAENVRSELSVMGLNGNPLRVVGYGESRQVNPGAAASDPGAEANRRVVFVIETSGNEGVVALALP